MNNLGRERDYMMRMRPLLKKKALYHDGTEMFVSPMEPDPGEEVEIRFRTAKNNADAVFLCSKSIRVRMEHTSSKQDFDYYSAKIRMRKETFSYFFEIQLGNTVCYYSCLGLSHEQPKNYVFRIIPGFHTPNWAKGAVMYQIYTDRFRNGDTTNDVINGEYTYINAPVKKVANWYQVPENMDVRNFYGGDLKGVLERMDYLQELGIEVIYFNPLFVSPSNHKYDIQDYDHIDPHFGKIVTEEELLLNPGDNNNSHARKFISRVTDKRNLEASDALFAKLVEEAHRRGIRVILDGVFNHCGSFNKWMDRERLYENAKGYEKGAYVAEDSPYHNYFTFAEGGHWPYNDQYDGWWGHETLPKLNYEGSEELMNEVLAIGAKWVSPPFNADGWRLDVAADLGHSSEFNHEFWRKFRKAVKAANPEAIILAEHYGDADAWLAGDQWDTVMNYDAFMEPISWFLTGMEKHSDSYREDLLGNADSFRDAMRYHMASYTMPSLLTSMNELDNHDHSRFLTRTNHKVGRVQSLGSQAAEEDVDPAILREGVVMQMTWPGAPTVYYGDEAGVCGFTDPDNRRTYPWGTEDQNLIHFYKEAIALHKEREVLRTGSVVLLFCDYNVLVYARFNQNEHVIIAINNRMAAYELEAPIWPAGLSRLVPEKTLTQVLSTDEFGFSTEKRELIATSGILRMHLEPESAVVLECTTE